MTLYSGGAKVMPVSPSKDGKSDLFSGLNRNLCSRPVANKNSSFLAKDSPRQTLGPIKT